MKRHDAIRYQLQRLVAEGEWIFAVGLRIRFNHPTLLYQTYPEGWVAHYAQNGLLFSDPAVMWGMTNTGICDWKDLESIDRAGVLRKAREFGLNHGIVVSVGDTANRSIGFFARSDAPLSEPQRALAQEVMQTLHDLTDGLNDLPPAAVEELARLNSGLIAARH